MDKKTKMKEKKASGIWKKVLGLTGIDLNAYKEKQMKKKCWESVLR